MDLLCDAYLPGTPVALRLGKGRAGRGGGEEPASRPPLIRRLRLQTHLWILSGWLNRLASKLLSFAPVTTQGVGRVQTC